MDNRWIIILLFIFMAVLLTFTLMVILIRDRRIRRDYEEISRKTREKEEFIRQLQAEIDHLKTSIVNEIASYNVDQKNAQDTVIFDGDVMANLILNKTASRCRDMNVQFEYRIGSWPEGILDEIELVQIVGNILDNAVDAAREVRGKVLIKAEEMQGNWFLSVENDKPTSSRPLNNGMKTTKTDTDSHGHGSGIIDKTVRRKGGSIKREDLGDRFRVLVRIPIETGGSKENECTDSRR